MLAQRRRRLANIETTLCQCFALGTESVVDPDQTTTNKKCWPDAGLMLGHRLRRWPNIKPTSVLHPVYAGMSVYSMCTQCVY